MGRKRNVHGGGANTNKNGLAFEEKMNLLTALENVDGVVVNKNNEVFKNGVLIGLYCPKHSFYKISNWKLISSFGKYTYGMYCYHMIVFFIVLLAFHFMGINLNGMSKYTFLFVLLISFFLTLLVSELSYHYYESFFLKLKNKYSLIRKE